MLAASIHEHAGLGNQIWRYVSCRVFAEHKGYEWGVSHPCLLYTSDAADE